MKMKDFLAEFCEDQFPSDVGPWIGIDYHDPPFTRTELKQMVSRGLVLWNSDQTKYCLTLKAANMRASLK